MLKLLKSQKWYEIISKHLHCSAPSASSSCPCCMTLQGGIPLSPGLVPAGSPERRELPPVLSLGTCWLFPFQDLSADLVSIPRKSFRIRSDWYWRPTVFSQIGCKSSQQVRPTQSSNHCCQESTAAIPCSHISSSSSCGCSQPGLTPLIFPRIGSNCLNSSVWPHLK